MNEVKLKICGMKLNISEVAALHPDYLGFIFYDKSPRYFHDNIPELPSSISKVGVFVNASIEEIYEKTKTHKLSVVQLHGEESPEFCKKLNNHFKNITASAKKSLLNPSIKLKINSIEVWKVFGVKDVFNFEVLEAYENVVDKFLFDTKGKDKGGNGYTFNWASLNEYPSKKAFVLSGGIGLGELDALKRILNTRLPIHAIDVNSKFEAEPGLKNIPDLNKLINWLHTKNTLKRF